MAVSCCVPPITTVGVVGVTAMDTNAGALTVSNVDVLMLPDAAPMVLLPFTSEVARPVVLIVATVVVADVHVTVLLKFWVLWSLNVPVAVNCCVCPAAMVGFAGVIASERRAGGRTVKPVAPVTLPDVAIIFALPTLTACARPEALMVTNVVALELHVTDAVRLLELPSLNCPCAVNC
jgi:hypothetical protein